MTLDELKVEAQSALDDLWAMNQIPFQLTAHRVESLGQGEYIVRFWDRRLDSLDVSWESNLSFKDAVSVAVFDRVARLPQPPIRR
jgi:hypothetical protein